MLDTIPPAMLSARAGHDYSFYNLSQHNLKTVANDPDTLEQNLRSYINQFSENVRDIFEKYKFEDTIADLAAHNLLYQVIQHFSRVNLHPENVSNEEMGNIFEELIRKFAEASNETAGEHFTPREVIELMVNLLLADDEDLRTDYIARSVYDPTAGTGGMLSVADDKIHQLNPTADVSLLGQELNPESYAICKADMVVKGQDVDNIALGNTLTDPAFENRTFHYGLSNPPFGVDWKGAKAVVEAEHKNQGFTGRFGAGLPRVSDGSLLFLQHLFSKLNEPTVTSNACRYFENSARQSTNLASTNSNIVKNFITPIINTSSQQDIIKLLTLHTENLTSIKKSTSRVLNLLCERRKATLGAYLSL